MDRIETIIEDLRRRLEATEAELATLREQAGRDDEPFKPVFPATVTGTTWQERAIVDGEWVDFVDGRVCDDSGSDSAITPLEGATVLLAVRDGDAMRYVEVGGGGQFFPVKLTQVGGVDGGDSNPAGWTYTAKYLDDTDVQNGEELQVVMQTPNGSAEPAIHGFIVWSIDDEVYKIWWLDEYIYTDTQCDA